MGGYGSGRPGWRARVEDCHALDITCMTRDGIFDGDDRRSGSVSWSDPYTGKEFASIGFELDSARGWMCLRYRLAREDESIDFEVPLTTTELPWGGVRWWFICTLRRNGVDCGRRVSKLLLPPQGRLFGCRHCHDLTYKSCQESHRYDSCDRRQARDIGVPIQEIRRMWRVDDGREERNRRNEQRRRRRKARKWA